MEHINIIGIDCATQPKNIGLAYGTSDREIISAHCGKSSMDEILTIISGWINPNQQTLLAIDAPLGWPVNMGNQLNPHQAGEKINTEANLLFRRDTDRFLKKQIGKQPLDVGADRIARTAYSALSLIESLRQQTGLPIPLAWFVPLQHHLSVIEVYPAATLVAHHLRATGYKGQKNAAVRRKMINSIGQYLTFSEEISDAMVRCDHVFDAVLCIQTGIGFLTQKTIPPENLALAKKEGWIWFYPPERKNGG